MPDVPIPIGRVQVATPSTMAASIRGGTEATAAVDERFGPALSQALESDPGLTGFIQDAAIQKLDESLANRQVVKTTPIDPRVSTWSITGENGQATFAEGTSDGLPTRYAAKLISQGLTFDSIGMGGGGAFVDANDQEIPNLSWQEDGMPTDEVVGNIRSRMNWSPAVKIGRGVPTDTQGVLAEKIQTHLTSALTSLNGATPSGYRTNWGGTAESHIRHPASDLYGASVIISQGLWSGEIATPLAKETVVRFTTSLALSHVANAENPSSPPPTSWGGPWGDNSGYTSTSNHGWQGLLWAGLIAQSASNLRSDFSGDEWAAVRNMIGWEADKLDTIEPPAYGTGGTLHYPGDSKAEENAWNAQGVVAALDVFGPEEPRFEKWLRKAVRFSLSATATRRGTEVQDSLNGVNLGDLSGWNLNDDGTVINHMVPHPNYMIAATLPGIHSAAIFAKNGWPVPEAFMLNAELVYKALQSVAFPTTAGWASPGGTMYRPGSGSIYYPDSGVSVGGVADKVAMDFAAHCLSLPSTTPALDWASLHLSSIDPASATWFTAANLAVALECADSLPSAEFTNLPISKIMEEINNG
mgnify:CR=1 FL=1